MGVMGYQIAALFYVLGYRVAVLSRRDIDKIKLNKSVNRINRLFNLNKQKNGEFKICTEFCDIYDSYTIDAVSEDLMVKKEIYHKIREVTSAPYLTNTSSYAPNEIANDVIGLHFFNPIQLKIIELTDYHDEVNQLLDVLEVAGFNIVSVNQNRGYIGNFLLFHEIGAALKLIDKHGYSADSVQSIYNTLYDGRNIFLILDLIGLDVAYNIFKNLKEKDDSFYLPECIGVAIESGVLGKKNKTSILDVIKKK